MPQTHAKQDLERVRSYYCTQRELEDSNSTIYQIWEGGGAFNDSVTPSTYSPEYRSHIGLKLLDLSDEDTHVLSIGCGNGFVEADLVQGKRVVQAIDCNEEAVSLAIGKGVDAKIADFFELQPADVAKFDVVYADGLIGHHFDAKHELTPVLKKLKSLSLKPGTYLLFSNDSPRDAHSDFAAHEKVEDFWFIARDYLRECLIAEDFEVVESYYFPYVRPISGVRNRTICIARVPEA